MVSSAFLANRKILVWLIVLVSIEILLSPLIFSRDKLRFIDNYWLDYISLQAAKTNKASNNIVIIEIDDASLDYMASKVGTWPWPRAIFAELTEILYQSDVKLIAFDILFSAPDLYREDSDKYFGEVIAEQADKIILSAFHLQTDQNHLFPLIKNYKNLPVLKQGESSARAHFVLPAAIPSNYWQLGLINYSADTDGIARSYDLVYQHQGWEFASLPQVLANKLNLKNDKKRLRLNWYHSDVSFRTMSIAEVFRASSEKLDLKQAIVIVGASAKGLHDTHATILSPYYPGPKVLATVLDNLQQGIDFVVLPWWSSWLVFCLLIVVMSLTAIVFEKVRPCLVLSVISIALLVSLSLVLVYKNVLFPINLIVIVFLIHVFFTVLLIYRSNRDALSNTLNTFSRFMDPDVVKHLLREDSTKNYLAPKTQQLTVLFSDIRNFTTLSEQHSAEEIVGLLNKFFNQQVDVIFRHGGTLDKFIGDAIMAFWGAPIESDEQEKRAIAAALDMVEVAKKFAESEGFSDFRIGVGIHSGPAVVGAIGSMQRSDYTAIGDTVNVASRIEGLTKTYGNVLVSKTVMEACRDDYYFAEKGSFQVKGREEAVILYEPALKR